MAIGTRAELIDWQIKGFDETYSRKKVKKIWRAIEHIIERYDIQVIGVKLPPKHLRREGLTYCLKYVTEKALEKDCTLYFCDLADIEAHFLKIKPKKKIELAEAISDKYPELKKEYFKLKKCEYHMKVFEAVGALELAFNESL